MAAVGAFLSQPGTRTRCEKNVPAAYAGVIRSDFEPHQCCCWNRPTESATEPSGLIAPSPYERVRRLDSPMAVATPRTAAAPGRGRGAGPRDDPPGVRELLAGVAGDPSGPRGGLGGGRRG